MSNNQANQCPECKTFVFGDYCFICKKKIVPKNITEEFMNLFEDGNLNPFKQIFDNN